MLDGLTLAGTLFAVTRFGPRQGSPACEDACAVW
jgi:hypothetical protein